MISCHTNCQAMVVERIPGKVQHFTRIEIGCQGAVGQATAFLQF